MSSHWWDSAPEGFLDDFSVWCDDAERTDVTYHRARRELWVRLADLHKRYTVWTRRLVPSSQWNSIKSALTSRNETMSDDKRLAFDTAVQEVVLTLSLARGPEGEWLSVKKTESPPMQRQALKAKTPPTQSGMFNPKSME